MRLLVDVNVCLDVLLDRAPFSEASSRIWSLVEEGKVDGLVPAHGVTTIHYLVAGTRDRATARRFVGDLLRVFRVAAVDGGVLQRALGLGMRYFEDAVCAAAAEVAGCDLVVTRNGKDYADSPVTAVDPITALALVDGGGSTRVSERSTSWRRETVRSRRGGGAARAAR